MKLAQINAVCTGSTGKICAAIAEKLEECGDDSRVFYALGQSAGEKCVRYTDALTIKTQALRAKLSGNYGFTSETATERLIAALEEYSPDLIHLHNLHSHNIHLDKLFSYLAGKQKKVVWTFHDCWAFTGYCVHFDRIGCEKWKTLCRNCPQRGEYSFFLDRSEELYRRKRELFHAVDLTIVTPSEWMGSLVRQSFLRDKQIEVIPNGIDLRVFQPRESAFRAEHNLETKKIVLGVAYQWDTRKGLDVMIKLSRRLPADHTIVLVGTDETLERELPENIVSIRRTQNQAVLAELYAAADVFVNPTREDTFPTVNLEALACGTPIVTFQTGGSAECLTPACGAAVEKNDIDALEQAVCQMTLEGHCSPDECVARARHFDRDRCFARYLELYRCLLS